MIELKHICCMEYMKGLPDKAFDLAICDPPYGIGYSELVGVKKESDGWKKRNGSKWDKQTPTAEYFKELKRVSVNQIIWGGNYFMDNLNSTRCFLIWDKVQRIDQADCEFAWTSFSSSARVFSYARGNDSGFAPKLPPEQKPFANLHPTQKPVKLYKWLLKNYAKEGDKIFDSHGGSMSIALACHDLNFDLVCCEIDKDYFEAAVKRFENHKKQLTIF